VDEKGAEKWDRVLECLEKLYRFYHCQCDPGVKLRLIVDALDELMRVYDVWLD
jgi:hypothetical protein